MKDCFFLYAHDALIVMLYGADSGTSNILLDDANSKEDLESFGE